MLEQLINLKTAIRKRKPKMEVRKKFIEYDNAYEEKERDIKDKLQHRDVFLIYSRYMVSSGIA